MYIYAHIYIYVYVYLISNTLCRTPGAYQGLLHAGYKAVRYLFVAFFHWSKWKLQALGFYSPRSSFDHAGCQSGDAHSGQTGLLSHEPVCLPPVLITSLCKGSFGRKLAISCNSSRQDTSSLMSCQLTLAPILLSHPLFNQGRRSIRAALNSAGGEWFTALLSESSLILSLWTLSTYKSPAWLEIHRLLHALVPWRGGCQRYILFTRQAALWNRPYCLCGKPYPSPLLCLPLAVFELHGFIPWTPSRGSSAPSN